MNKADSHQIGRVLTLEKVEHLVSGFENDFGDYDRNDAYRTLIIMVMTMMIKLAEY